MLLILGGLGGFAYGLSAITAFWVEGELSHVWETRRMERRIAKLKDHVIVCGGGNTGRHIMRELIETRTSFVCVEIDPRQEDDLHKLGPDVVYLFGDATDGDVLRQARVDTARGLIACMPSDKDNLFTILTARELNARLRIVSRLVSDESGPKLLKAGADGVVSVPTIGALRIASAMIRPQVVTVLDAMLREPGGMRVQEIRVGRGADGQTLGGLRVRDRLGIIVFALREDVTKRYHFNPPPDRVLRAGDILFACATAEQHRAAVAMMEG
jgi:voltage-gated potassium channel